MGYYTYYSCHVYDNFESAAEGNLRDEIINQRTQLLAKEFMEEKGLCCIVNIRQGKRPFDDLECNEMKWYDCDVDMIELSEKYPEYFFRLDGAGEERDDNWRTIYHAGKMCESRARVVWDDFDKNVFLECSN